MCVVSNIGDGFADRWRDRFPNTTPYYPPINPYPTTNIPWTPPQVTKQEFDELKKEVEALKELLVAAKKYDEVSGQPDCHMDEKVELLRKVGEWIGVNFDEIFNNKK